MLGTSIQTTPAAISDCGGDLMAGDGPGTDVTGGWRSMSHNKQWTTMDEAEARRSESHMGAAE